MSKHFAAAFLALPLILQIFNNCFGQEADVTITIRSVSPPNAEIRGRLAQSSTNKNFSLLRDHAGFSNLANRVSDIRLEDGDGKPVAFRQFIPGEYVSANDFIQWAYQVDLTPQTRPAAAAHISWVGSEQGLLFLDDLLPLQSEKECRTRSVTLQVPNGWTAFGNESGRISCSDKAVYFLTKQHRRLNAASSPVELVVTAEWKFSDQQAIDLVDETYSAYKKLFGNDPSLKSRVYILPFPSTVGSGTWEADTRGSTVTILSSDMPFQTQSIQRLHEQLRHEIFHLWMPNAVYLKGNYDWFYEGFALYESLKLGLELNRLRFDDFLDTLSRAMTVDKAFTDHISLIDASNSRTNGGDTRLYARGMLIGFLTDLRVLSRSKGREDITQLLRAIYDKYKDPQNQTDGNEAILSAIADDEVRRYVETGATINWATSLAAAGIEKKDQTGSSLLSVKSDPTGSQKKLLDKLGYNNWRKSSVRPK